MGKRVIYPPDVWGLFARSWELALRADNKSANTIHAYIQAVRLLGEWAHRQQPIVAPTEIQPVHIRVFIVELVERTSPGNAHTNPGCSVVTFAEQAPGLSAPYRRRTLPLLTVLERVAWPWLGGPVHGWRRL